MTAEKSDGHRAPQRAVWLAGSVLWLVLGSACGVGNPASDMGSGLDGGLVADNGLQDGGRADSTAPSRPADCTTPTVTAACSYGYCEIPAGCFLMGSLGGEECHQADEVAHWVKLTRPFFISQTEVTVEQYTTLTQTASSALNTACPTCPAAPLNWHAAAAYSNAVSTAQDLETCYDCTQTAGVLRCVTAARFTGAGASIQDCKGYRLPTEAEWEYAYRAGTTTAYYDGTNSHCYNPDPMLDSIAWYSANSKTFQPVAGKADNAFGLYDMAGNAEEWVHDSYGAYPTTYVTDPVTDDSTATQRSARGGSYKVYPTDLRAADRNAFDAAKDLTVTGFRLVRTE